MKQALIVFTKVPIAGLVKTRLIPFLSPTKATELQKCFLVDIIDMASRLKNCDIVVAHIPPDKEALLKEIIGVTETSELKFIPQVGTNIGERMCNAFRDVFEMGYERAVLIGTDLPTLPIYYLERAFELLGSCDLVMGLNADGGYYLIGMQSLEKEIFGGVDWGTNRELPQTLLKIKQRGFKLACLDMWYDVDTPADLDFLGNHLEYLKTCGDIFPKRTYKFLKRLKA